MTAEQRLWSKTRDDLVRAVESLGFPAELGEAIAKHLGSPKAMGARDTIMKGWMAKENEMICCCSDGTRPVIFKVERIDYE